MTSGCWRACARVHVHWSYFNILSVRSTSCLCVYICLCVLFMALGAVMMGNNSRKFVSFGFETTTVFPCVVYGGYICYTPRVCCVGVLIVCYLRSMYVWVKRGWWGQDSILGRNVVRSELLRSTLLSLVLPVSDGCTFSTRILVGIVVMLSWLSYLFINWNIELFSEGGIVCMRVFVFLFFALSLGRVQSFVQRDVSP